MEIEIGRRYRTRNGRKASVNVKDTGHAWFPYSGHVEGSPGIWVYWRKNGSCLLGDDPHPHDLIAEWSDTPTLWRDMTDAEKGALLLAHHEGKVIEVWVVDHHASWWGEKAVSYWRDDLAYRVRPEPKRETAYLWASFPDGIKAIGTIELLEGEPQKSSIRLSGEQPVCDSIRMEPVK